MNWEIFIFGGTFDPMHQGHLKLISYVLSIYPKIQLVIMPSGVPAFKGDSCKTDKYDRLEMVHLAIEDLKDMYPSLSTSNLFVDSFEIQKNKVSYTIDSVMYAREKYKTNSINLLIGDDCLKDLKKWKSINTLKKMVNFFVFKRNNKNENQVFNTLINEYKKTGFRFTFLNNSYYSENSTSIRNGDLQDTSKRVKVYIKEHHLYGL